MNAAPDQAQVAPAWDAFPADTPPIRAAGLAYLRVLVDAVRAHLPHFGFRPLTGAEVQGIAAAYGVEVRVCETMDADDPPPPLVEDGDTVRVRAPLDVEDTPVTRFAVLAAVAQMIEGAAPECKGNWPEWISSPALNGFAAIGAFLHPDGGALHDASGAAEQVLAWSAEGGWVMPPDAITAGFDLARAILGAVATGEASTAVRSLDDPEFLAEWDRAAAFILDWGMPSMKPAVKPYLAGLSLPDGWNAADAYAASVGPLRLATKLARRAYEEHGVGWASRVSDMEGDLGPAGDILGIGFLFGLVNQWMTLAQAMYERAKGKK